MTEPRFINPHDYVVYVNRPDGHQIVVRPFRELGVLVGRQEKDCVVVGEHYRQFGQLAPFPEPEPVASSEGEGGSDLAAMAGQGGFRGTGDVISPDGTVRTDADGEGEGGEVVEPDAEVEDEDPAAVTEEDDEVEDEEDEEGVPDDADLEDVDGVGPKLAEQLKEFGLESAAGLAELQEDDDPQKLADACDGIKGAAHAERLILAAQTLLGYEEDGEDETE